MDQSYDYFANLQQEPVFHQSNPFYQQEQFAPCKCPSYRKLKSRSRSMHQMPSLSVIHPRVSIRPTVKRHLAHK